MKQRIVQQLMPARYLDFGLAVTMKHAAGRFQTEYNTEPVNRWEGLYTSLISDYGVGTWGIQFG